MASYSGTGCECPSESRAICDLCVKGCAVTSTIFMRYVLLLCEVELRPPYGPPAAAGDGPFLPPSQRGRVREGARVGTQSTLVPAVLVGGDLAGLLREPAGTAIQPDLLVGERRLFGGKQDFHDVPAVDAGRRRLNV